jgi:hypothetical protein
MDIVKILFIGADEKIVNTVVRLINKNPLWKAIPALTGEDAILRFEEDFFSLVMFGAGITAATEYELRSLFMIRNPNTIILQHYGGGSGLLSNEILHALGA